MRISIIVTDDKGNIFEGDAQLKASGVPAKPCVPKSAKRPLAPDKSTIVAPVNFSLQIRAFVKKHARGMGGPQRFALLAAYLSKGDIHKQVPFGDIEREWNRMKPLLGGKFNPAYSTRAKESGWVDSPRRGTYVLCPGWKGIFDA